MELEKDQKLLFEHLIEVSQKSIELIHLHPSLILGELDELPCEEYREHKDLLEQNAHNIEQGIKNLESFIINMEAVLNERINKSKVSRKMGISRHTIIRYVQKGLISEDEKGRVLIREILKVWHSKVVRKTKSGKRISYSIKREKYIPKITFL